MKIRGITEKWHRIFSNYAQHGYTAAVHARDFEEMRDDLASILEELALMEAVCEAAEALPCCDLGRDYPSGSCSGCSQKPVCDTTAALTAYREERGL